MPCPQNAKMPSDEAAAPRPFLRTASDPAVRSKRAQDPAQLISIDTSDITIFPPPELDDAIIARLSEWPSFSALAVRIDPPAGAAPDSALQTVVSACLEAIKSRCGGVWFAWNAGLYGGVLPGVDAGAAVAISQEIPAELAKSRVETVSIGISVYPQIDFSPAATLLNACKALDHAAFFGPASIVTFDAVSLNISGDHAYQRGDIDAAIAEYRTALRLDAANVNVHNSLGVCLAQTGQADDARALFEAARRIDPTEAMSIYNLGVLDLLQNNPPQALMRLREAYAVDDRTFDIPFQIGKLLAEEKAYSEALTFLNAAVSLRHAAPAYTLIGMCLTCLGQGEEAIAAYKRAVKINPNDADALSALGLLYDAKGENPDISITFCRQSVAVAPDNGLFRMHLAGLYHKHHQLDCALAEYRAAADLGCDAGRQIAQIQELLETDESAGRQHCA